MERVPWRPQLQPGVRETTRKVTAYSSASTFYLPPSRNILKVSRALGVNYLQQEWRDTLLQVYRELEIRGTHPSKLTTFINDLTKALSPGWTRDRTREREVNRVSGLDSQYAFSRQTHGLFPKVWLFLMRQASFLKVTNIVPQETGLLTRTQYNMLVEEFHRTCEPVAKKLGLQTHISPAEQDISELLSPKTFNALQLFSELANKTISHPLDRERWLKFLLLSHKDSGRLDPEMLMRWLMEEQRWPEDAASALSSEYRLALDVLEKYDQSNSK